MKTNYLYTLLILAVLLFCAHPMMAHDCPAAGTPCDDNDPLTSNDLEDGNCNCKGIKLCTTGTIQAKGPTGATRNPWSMTTQQYELFENTPVSAINAMPGTHPTYGALPLPDVSFYTNYPDNGPSPNGILGQFRFLAAPSHFLKDDPIVFPNQPGASHLHMFFGNTRADAYSEVGTGSQNDLLVKGASTVQGGKGANPSSYWIPAMVDGPLGGCGSERKIIVPDVITVYYKSRKLYAMKMVPQGLQIIGGNLPHNSNGNGMVHNMTIKNSGGGNFREGARWGFYNNGTIAEGQSTIPQTNPNGYKYIRAAIGFPQCFKANPDGSFVFSSPNNLSHQHLLEDSGGWNRDDLDCPGSHPNRIAKVEILIDYRWPANGDVSGWRLSSDMGADTDAKVAHPGGSLHGDILFAWNDKVQKAWKDECMDPNDPRNCSLGQTGTNWNLDRIENTSTITNMIYYGPNKALIDPYDCGSCPPAGTLCDDNDAATVNDAYDNNCNCTGTCITAGIACNDNDPDTVNDAWDGNCNCAGTCITAGTTCDDNDPDTVNDVWDGQCNCAGSCAPLGTPCDDNDPTTNNDAYDGLCNCIGIFVPGQGICQFDSPPVLDGYDNDWSADSILIVNKVLGGSIANPADLSAEFKLGWDENYLYIFGKITDDILLNDSPNPWNDDAFELYIDGGNEKATSYDANDFQLMFRYNDPVAYNFPNGPANPTGLDFAMISTNSGYNVEARASWAFLGIPPVTEGSKIGLDVHVNDDDDGGARDKFISWNDDQNLAWTNPSFFGEVLFEDCQPAFITPNICLWMEGVYDPSTNKMTTLLNQRNLLPLTQPYNNPPWNYAGSEMVNNFPSQSVDWVKVSFRTNPSKSSEVLATAAILQEDGCLVFPDPDFFPEHLGLSFYVVVEHRNHIGVMSPTSINVNQGTLTYDFRDLDSYSGGGQGQKLVGTGTWAMFAGDGDQLLDVNGYDINGIDNSSWLPQNGGFNIYGYADYNLDGDVSGMDKILWSENNGVYSTLDR